MCTYNIYDQVQIQGVCVCPQRMPLLWDFWVFWGNELVYHVGCKAAEGFLAFNVGLVCSLGSRYRSFRNYLQQLTECTNFCLGTKYVESQR